MTNKILSKTTIKATKTKTSGGIMRFFKWLFGGGDKPIDTSINSLQVLKELAYASHKEQVRARRWRIFFRLAYLIIIVVILSSIISTSRTDISDLSFGSAKRDIGDINEEHIAIIPIKGPVLADFDLPSSKGVVQYNNVADALHRAFDNELAKAIFLNVDSPGGNPVVASYIYNEIIKLRQEHPDKKVYAMVGDLGASAAYYISAAADEIYAHPMSLVGSIGVISAGFGFDELIDEYGIDRRVYHAGDNKAILDPFTPRNSTHEAYLQDILTSIHEQFIDDVKQGRGDRISDNPDVYSGLIYIGNDALDLGLIDGVGFFKEIVKDKTGLDNLVDYSVPEGLLHQLSEGIGASFANGLWQGIAQLRSYIFR